MLKKAFISSIALSAIASVAHADSSVTAWGNIDAGFMTSNATAGHTTGFVEGQLTPSEFGLKGSEDLGGGMTAGFALTGGFNSGTGTAGNEIGGTLFGREAKATLSGDWGKLSAGLQYDPALIASISTEPRGLTDGLANTSYWIIATVGNTPQGFTGGIFDTNAISYTYSGNGFWIGALHSFGGVAGSTTASSGNSIGASYTNSGFTISAGYAGADNAAGNTSSEIGSFGLGYATGPFAVRFQYDEFKSGYLVGGTAGDDVKSTGIGFDWKIIPANKLNLAIYSARDDGPGLGGKTTEIALMDVYSLSKSTSVFAQIASVHVGTGAGNSAFLAGVGAYTNAVMTASGTANMLGVGIQHSF